jgi:hypothetical protein
LSARPDVITERRNANMLAAVEAPHSPSCPSIFATQLTAATFRRFDVVLRG